MQLSVSWCKQYFFIKIWFWNVLCHWPFSNPGFSFSNHWIQKSEIIYNTQYVHDNMNSVAWRTLKRLGSAVLYCNIFQAWHFYSGRILCVSRNGEKSRSDIVNMSSCNITDITVCHLFASIHLFWVLSLTWLGSLIPLIPMLPLRNTIRENVLLQH